MYMYTRAVKKMWSASLGSEHASLDSGILFTTHRGDDPLLVGHVDGERRTRARELDDEDEEEDNHVEKQHHLEEHLISMKYWYKFEAHLVMFHGSN